MNRPKTLALVALWALDVESWQVKGGDIDAPRIAETLSLGIPWELV